MDLFICYASEDRDEVAQPLADELIELGYKVFYDKYSLKVGDSLKDAINEGLKKCRYGIVVFSKNFFRNKWPQNELAALYAREMAEGNKLILPVWHEITADEIRNHDLLLADIVAVILDDGICSAVNQIRDVIDKELKTDKRGFRTRSSKVAGIEVPQIPIVERFEKPLSKDEVLCDIETASDIPPELVGYYTANVETRVDALRKQGNAVTNGKGYGLKRIVIDKDQREGGGRYSWPNLIFEPTEYFHQVMFSERLDEPALIKAQGRDVSIREFSGVDFESFCWDDVARIPFPQRFACGIGLILPKSKDQPEKRCMVIGIRTDQAFVSEDTKEYWQASLSCAEGMVRPDDAGGSDDEAPSPFNTAVRALHEELGLTENDHYSSGDIVLICLGYDTQRCQPVAIFKVETSEIDFSDIIPLWEKAPDRKENKIILPVMLSGREFSSLLNNNISYKDKNVKLFSNHQLLGACRIAEIYGLT